MPTTPSLHLLPSIHAHYTLSTSPSLHTCPLHPLYISFPPYMPTTPSLHLLPSIHAHYTLSTSLTYTVTPHSLTHPLYISYTSHLYTLTPLHPHSLTLLVLFQHWSWLSSVRRALCLRHILGMFLPMPVL